MCYFVPVDLSTDGLATVCLLLGRGRCGAVGVASRKTGEVGRQKRGRLGIRRRWRKYLESVKLEGKGEDAA